MAGRRCHDWVGGGHYAPRHKAIISETEVWVGHILANYAIVFEGQEESSVLGSTLFVLLWILLERYPGDVFAHLDRNPSRGGKDRHYPPSFRN